MYTIVLAVLLSVVVTVRGAEREFLFPIVTHVGGHSSTMFVLNPTEYKVRYGLTGHSPYSGHSGLSSTLEPNSIESFRPDFDLNPSDFGIRDEYLRRGGRFGVQSARNSPKKTRGRKSR